MSEFIHDYSYNYYILHVALLSEKINFKSYLKENLLI